MATQMVPTASMRAYADVLLSRSARWARGTRNRDGLQYVTFVSSRVTKDGQPIYHHTVIDGSACDCPGYLWRGACSHALACRLDTERARGQTARPRPTYDELMDNHLVDAF